MTARRIGSCTWGAASPTPPYSSVVSRKSRARRSVAGERISVRVSSRQGARRTGCPRRATLRIAIRARAPRTGGAEFGESPSGSPACGRCRQKRARFEAPPSMVMMVPVVLAERSEARKATMSPMCSGFPGGKSWLRTSRHRAGSPRSRSAMAPREVDEALGLDLTGVDPDHPDPVRGARRTERPGERHQAGVPRRARDVAGDRPFAGRPDHVDDDPLATRPSC